MEDGSRGEIVLTFHSPSFPSPRPSERREKKAQLFGGGPLVGREIQKKYLKKGERNWKVSASEKRGISINWDPFWPEAHSTVHDV